MSLTRYVRILRSLMSLLTKSDITYNPPFDWPKSVQSGPAGTALFDSLVSCRMLAKSPRRSDDSQWTLFFLSFFFRARPRSQNARNLHLAAMKMVYTAPVAMSRSITSRRAIDSIAYCALFGRTVAALTSLGDTGYSASDSSMSWLCPD
jgi:hypothetical protein